MKVWPRDEKKKPRAQGPELFSSIFRRERRQGIRILF
jgi:hypothetical protein